MESSQLEETQRDELQELGNIGAGRASRYLSDLADNKVNIGIPQVDIVSLSSESDEVSQIMDVPAQEQLMAVLMPTEEPSGGIVFLFTQEDYQKFLQMGDGEDFLDISEKVSNYYIDALESFLSLEVETGEPRLISLPLNTLLIQISSSIEGDGSDALIINTEFSIEEEESKTTGEITFFLEIEDIDSIIQVMEDKL